jgi:hypothetical protein
MPGRPLGFAPQIAMALFSGSIVKDKKFAFLMPLFSMLLSDILFSVLFYLKAAPYGGTYPGQITNYVLFIAITVIGFAVNKHKWYQIAAGSVAGVLFYFVASNFAQWAGNGPDINGVPYSNDFDGLMKCIYAGIPFLKGSFYATLFFSGILFGGYSLLGKYVAKEKTAIA